jgi:hypothetical protein
LTGNLNVWTGLNYFEKRNKGGRCSNLYVYQLFFISVAKSATIAATPSWLSIFNPIAEVDVTIGSQSQTIERVGQEVNHSLASVELNRHTTEIVKIVKIDTHHPQANNLSKVGDQTTANQMIIEPLPQDIQGQERVNVIVDQEQEPQEGRGGTMALLATEAVFQAEDDFQMSVHSDLGLSYGFPLLASDVVLYGLVSSLSSFRARPVRQKIPRNSLSLFLRFLLYRVLLHFFLISSELSMS